MCSIGQNGLAYSSISPIMFWDDGIFLFHKKLYFSNGFPLI